MCMFSERFLVETDTVIPQLHLSPKAVKRERL